MKFDNRYKLQYNIDLNEYSSMGWGSPAAFEKQLEILEAEAYARWTESFPVFDGVIDASLVPIDLRNQSISAKQTLHLWNALRAGLEEAGKGARILTHVEIAVSAEIGKQLLETEFEFPEMDYQDDIQRDLVLFVGGERPCRIENILA